MKIKPKPRPLNTLNISTQEHTDHFISGTEVKTSAHQNNSWNIELGIQRRQLLYSNWKWLSVWKRKLPLKPWRGTLNPSPVLKTIPIVRRRLWPDRLRVDDHYLHALELSESSERRSVSLSIFVTWDTGLGKEYDIQRKK